MTNTRAISACRGLLERRPVPVLAVLSLVLELVIELLGHSPFYRAFVFIGRSPHMFLLNAAIIFLTLLPTLLVRRKVFYCSLASLLWLVCGVVNCAMLAIRSNPFSARDFSMLALGFMIADVYLSVPAIIGIAAGLAAFLGFIVYLFLRAPRSGRPEHGRRNALIACALAAAVLIPWIVGMRCIRLSSEYESLNEAFASRGFPYCFAATIFDSGVSRPEDYSKARVDGLELDGPAAADKGPNIILIQLESFFDPALIRGVQLAEDPIPCFTELRDTCASGFLRMPTLGAGTVNAEFEVLTGMSLDYFGIGEYPYESILRDNTCESIAYYLKDLGYRTHAVHNYGGSFYGRNEVYPNLGFEDFTSVEYMHDVAVTEKGWPKDAVLTEYILEAMEQTEGLDFVFTVTVQCHGSYPEDSVVDDIRFRGNEVFEGYATDQFRYYVKQLQGTDRFLRDLIDALEDWPEETVVIAYGDHLPSLELTDEDLVNGSLFQTEYFIWSNYGPGVGEEDRDLSAYQLTARVFDILGMQGGVLTEYHREHMGLEDYQDGLEVLEYDLLYGDRIAYGGSSPYKKTEMKMGLEEIAVTEIVIEGDLVRIDGRGFTEYSVVYVNGRRREDTVYVSPRRLFIPNEPRSVSPEDRIQVCQTGQDRVVLSTASPPG